MCKGSPAVPPGVSTRTCVPAIGAQLLLADLPFGEQFPALFG